MNAYPRSRRRARGPLAAMMTAGALLVSFALGSAAHATTPVAVTAVSATTATTPNIAAVSAGHPRLMADAARLEQLRTQQAQDPVSKALADRVLAEAETLRSEPRINYTISGGRMLSSATELVDRTYTLVVAWVVSGDRSYLDLLWKDLGPATKLTSWNPDHMLDGAEFTHASAIAYDWAHSAWTSTQRSQMRTAIVKLGLEPSLKIYSLADGAKSPYRYLGNWRLEPGNINTNINSAMILGALAVAKDATSTSVQSVLTGASKSIRSGLSEYKADGGFPEGATYWAYATRSAMAALLSLKTATGSDYGLASVGGLSKTASFALDLRSSAETIYNFADSSSLPGVVNLPLAGLARLYNSRALGAASAVNVPGSYTRAAQQLIMRDPSWKGVTPATGSLNSAYSTGVVTARSSTTSPDATYLAFRSATAFEAPHQQMDAGDFQLASLGEEWAVELGLEEATYDLSNPARSSARWNYYRTTTIGHNTLTIAPSKASAGQPSATVAGRVSSAPDEFFATTNASATFADSVSSWKRGVRLIDGRTNALVQDEITTATTVDAMWGMHTRAQIKISADGRQAILSQNGKRLLARIVSGPGTTFSDMPAAPLPSSPQPSQELNDDVRRLSIWFSANAGATTTLAVQFTPLLPGTDASAPPRAAKVTTLSSWTSMGTASVLTGISVGGQKLAGFSGKTASYDVPISDPSSLPKVSATGTGTISTVQATRSSMTARITVTNGTARATTYVVRFVVAGDSAVVDGRTARDPRSQTVDGRPETAWDPASVSSRSLVWRLDEPVPLRSVMLTMASSTHTPTEVRLEVSPDRSSWSAPYGGTFDGPTATKAFPVASASPIRFVRITVPRGDAKIAEARFLRYDASPENVAPPRTVPTKAALSGFATKPNVGATGQARTSATWSNGTATTTTKWMTSNSKVVSVTSSGGWRAVGRGTAQVGAIVTSPDRVSATATVSVTVVDPTRIRIPVLRDTYVAGSEPSKNFGSSATILNKPTTSAALERIGYLAFDVTPIAGREVRSAVLTVPAVIKDNSTVSTARIDLHPVTAAWSESSMTYANRPASGSTVASILATKTEQAQSADLTKHLAGLAKAGTKTASYSLSQDGVGAKGVVVSMPSKEFAPGAYIEVVLAPASADTVPPSRLGSVSATGAPSSLAVGKSATLAVTAKASTGGTFTRAKITYSTTDSAIMKVSSTGIVTGVSPGGATLSVTATADGIAVTWTKRILITKQ